MPLVTQHSRQLLKRSIISGATPTVFTGSTNHTDGTWGINDIYAGEMYWNMDDRKLWVGWENSSGNTGVDLIYPSNSSTGSCQTDFYTNNIFPCDINLPIIGLSSLSGVDCQLVIDGNSGSNEFAVYDNNVSYFSRIDLQSTPTINLTCDDSVKQTNISMSNNQISLDVNTNSYMQIASPLIIIENGDGVNITNEIRIQDDNNGIRLRTNETAVSTATIAMTTTGGVSLISLDADFYDITLQSFADDAAAGTGGLVTGNLYQTNGLGAAPLNVAGIVMIKQ